MLTEDSALQRAAPRRPRAGSESGASAYRKRVPAAAAARFLGVLEAKALEHQRMLVVERRARQINQALLVDVKLHPVELVDRVLGAGWIVRVLDHVVEARAAAASHAEPNRRVGRAARREALSRVIHGL